MTKPSKVYKYSIDGVKFETENKIITGAELRSKGNVPNDYEIYLEVHGSGDDELITATQEVDLSEPGREKFYSSKPNTNNG